MIKLQENILKEVIKAKIKELQEYNKTNIAFNRKTDADYTNFLIGELQEVLAADNPVNEINNKIEMYKKAEKIDDSTGKYTFQYNVYLDLKRLKEELK